MPTIIWILKNIFLTHYFVIISRFEKIETNRANLLLKSVAGGTILMKQRGFNNADVCVDQIKSEIQVDTNELALLKLKLFSINR